MLLLDAAISEDEIDKIKKIIKKQPKVTDFHEFKTRQV